MASSSGKASTGEELNLATNQNSLLQKTEESLKKMKIQSDSQSTQAEASGQTIHGQFGNPPRVGSAPPSQTQISPAGDKFGPAQGGAAKSEAAVGGGDKVVMDEDEKSKWKWDWVSEDEQQADLSVLGYYY